MGKSNNTKLKVGLILNSAEIPVWVSSIINEINDSAYASVDLLLTSKINHIPTDSKNTWKNGLYSLYCKLEKYRWTGREEDCLAIEQNVISVKKETADLTVPDVVDLESVKAYNLDVLINLAGENVSDKFLVCAQSGVWLLHYKNGETKMQTSPVGFWEIYDGAATMELTLDASLKTQVEPLQLHRSLFATDDRSSALMNQCNAHRITRIVVLRKLKQLHEIGQTSFIASHVDAEEVKVADKLRSNPPGNFRMLRFFAVRVLNSIKMSYRKRLFSRNNGHYAIGWLMACLQTSVNLRNCHHH